MIEILRSKIHRATVTMADVNYEGSITISEELMTAANIHEFQKVVIADINNYNRFETYVLKTTKKNYICVNGAAAGLVKVDDLIIIMSYNYIEESQAVSWKPTVVLVNNDNTIKSVT